MVGVCALVKKGADGNCEDVRVGLTHMASTPLRASATEEALRGGPLDASSIAAAAEHAAEGTEPPGDLNATAGVQAAPGSGAHAPRAGGGRRALSFDSPAAVQEALAGEVYLADRGLSVAVFLPRRSSSRCCSRGRQAWARPRWPRRWRRPPARG